MNSFDTFMDMPDNSVDFCFAPDFGQSTGKEPQVDLQSRVSSDSIQILLEIVRHQVKAAQQLDEVQKKLDQISKKTDHLERKMDEQNERLEKLEMYLLERSQAIIERQNDCIGLLESPGYALSAYNEGSDSLSDYSDSEFSQDSAPNSGCLKFLYSTNLASLTRNQMIQRKTDQFQHETPYTNGHIYSKLREYVVNSRDYNDWYMRLSPNKRNNFQAINGHPGVQGALDRLICFPGIMDALFLGNICKYSAWGLLKEFQTCLNYIYNQWSGYTRGDHAIQHDVTPETVKLLEGRAPATSLSDREWIRAVFRAGMVFPSTTNQKQRDDLEKAILRSPGVIPGLRSCQANLLYMGIAAQITLTLLIPNELKRTVKAEDGVVTLRSVLRKCWVETEPYVEVREGEFQSVLGGPNFDLAYNTVIIAALRQFAFMSRDEPKIEAGDSTMQILSDDIYSCKALFQRRAKFLGFQNDLIDQGALKRISPFQPETSPLKEDEEAFLSRVEHRWATFPTQHLQHLAREVSASIT
ncbi:hypothetical protein FOBRF1_011625 [Fusarium oxysporum]